MREGRRKGGVREDNAIEEILYKGWTIRPKPYQLADSGKWCPKAEMDVVVRGVVHSQILEGPEGVEFNSEEEARKYSINMAMKWIDENG